MCDGKWERKKSCYSCASAIHIDVTEHSYPQQMVTDGTLRCEFLITFNLPIYLHFFNLFSAGHGGGWGYSGHSIEAIRFMADTDILLGGFGLFGGRGEYTGKIKVVYDVFLPFEA